MSQATKILDKIIIRESLFKKEREIQTDRYIAKYGLILKAG